MSEQNRDSPFPLFSSITVPAILLLGLAAISRSGSDVQLTSVRPKEVRSQEERRLEPPEPLNAVYSRLWEDPIAVAEQDALAYDKATNSQKKGSPEEQLVEQRMQITRLQKYFRRLLRKDAEAGAKPQAKPEAKPGSGSGSVAAAAAEPKEKEQLLLLPVMVPGAPYSEDAEQRKRTRYAVVSALGTAGYQLKYPTRVTYVRVPIRAEFAAGKENRIRELVMPVKLYSLRDVWSTEASSSKRYEKILVCWINEDVIGDDPSDALEQIAQALFGNTTPALDKYQAAEQLCVDPGIGGSEKHNDLRNRFAVKILGPADSDTLREIVKTGEKKGDETEDSFLHEHGAEILVTRATVTSNNLSKVSNEGGFDVPGSTKPLAHSPFTLKRIIGTDQALADAIAAELTNRSVAPDGTNLVVLLTERDSLYGAAFSNIFKEAVASDRAKREPPSANDVRDSVHMITYLRGLDGISVGKDMSGLSKEEIDRPEGRSQYDYVRRIREQIRALEMAANPPARGLGEFIGRKPAVRAIGVVGTDVYDKLLLLRSLRNHFPNVVFFTTDLDASFSYHKEYPHTRNLLVASHFGLNLRSTLQADVLPFRGSYQTSTFLATLAAVEHFKIGELTEEAAQPLLFEIGRNGAYQLTHTKTSAIQPLGNQEWQPNVKVMLAWVAVILLFCVIVGTQFDRTRKIFLKLITYDAFRKKTAREILRQGGVKAIGISIVVIGLPVAILGWSRIEASEPFSLTEGISAWPGILITFVAAVYSITVLYRVYSATRKEARFARKLCKTALGEIPACPDVAFEPLYKWRIIDDDHAPTIKKLVCEFLAQCRPRAQLRRVFLLVISYALFSCLVWSLTPHDLFGIRGFYLQWVSRSITLCAFVLFIVVSATTIDAVQVCRLLIKRLGRGTKGWDENADAILADSEYRDEFEATAVKSVTLIAATTDRVSGMIWYTFIAACLLLAAQYPYFEFYALPWSTCAIIFPLIVGNVVSYILLRNGAVQARDSLVASLRQRPLLKDHQSTTTKEALQVISEIRSGALAPLSQDPLVRALSVPLGGTTGLIALEQILRSISG